MITHWAIHGNSIYAVNQNNIALAEIRKLPDTLTDTNPHQVSFRTESDGQFQPDTCFWYKLQDMIDAQEDSKTIPCYYSHAHGGLAEAKAYVESKLG